ncbi:hypothetical protein Zmor_013103 [Zophobas morio]|uniref:Spaetzle domain-containing protein n=1 Tax=Zophobas morio TaxID=2755281 RepID=A0AA38MFB3_9CUCU|nr:hypothetical protein Zmor_013103 [Zophobas morio]
MKSLFQVFSVLVKARPQLTVPIQAFNKVGSVLNDSAATFIKKLTTSNASRDDGNNKTRTRILFRGDLLSDFSDQDIIFPDAYQVIFENVPRINTAPKCAKGKTYCEDFDPYPYNQVKDMLQRKHIRNDLFGKDEPPEDRYSITNRNGDFESFVCTSVQKTVFPRVGKNKNNKWKFIINQEESDGYVQGIRIEVCRKEGSACDLIGERVNGYITSCKQKYMLRRMMSLSENGDPMPDTFQLPSACCCSYRKDLSFLSRFGIEDISARSKAKTRP